MSITSCGCAVPHMHRILAAHQLLEPRRRLPGAADRGERLHVDDLLRVRLRRRRVGRAAGRLDRHDLQRAAVHLGDGLEHLQVVDRGLVDAPRGRCRRPHLRRSPAATGRAAPCTARRGSRPWSRPATVAPPLSLLVSHGSTQGGALLTGILTRPVSVSQPSPHLMSPSFPWALASWKVSGRLPLALATVVPALTPLSSSSPPLTMLTTAMTPTMMTTTSTIGP